LNRVQAGDPNAASELLPLVYDELRKLAAARMMGESADHTLQPTALVHEAWLRLTGNDSEAQFANRAHFFFGGSRSDETDLDRSCATKVSRKAWPGLGTNQFRQA
jgi:hypothetical protein